MAAESHRVPVLIASWLDQRHVDRIAAAEPERIEVMYEPDLLPRPRYEADHHGPRRELSSEQLQRWRDQLARAEVSFEFDWDDPTKLLERAPRLRWVQATSSGIGPLIKRLGLTDAPLIVTNAAGIHAQSLAEFVLLGALYFAKEMPRLSIWKSARHWERYCGDEIAGTRMLIVGLGKVGSRAAELCGAVGIEVIGLRRSAGGPVPRGVRRMIDASQLDAELPELDYFVLAAPDTPATANLLNRERIGRLPERAVVINVGRGSLVDEPALIEALAEGKLRGAALDVFAREPLPVESPLWSLPNVIIAPHSASTVRQENDRLVDLFVENLHRYLDGRPLQNQFDRSQLS